MFYGRCKSAGGESEWREEERWKVAIGLFIVARFFMKTLSGWKESQAALQVSRLQQLLRYFTADAVLIFRKEKKRLFFLTGNTFLFIPD